MNQWDQLNEDAGNRLLADSFFGTNNIAVIVETAVVPVDGILFEDRLAAALTDYSYVVALRLPSVASNGGNVPGPFVKYQLNIEAWCEQYILPGTGTLISVTDICQRITETLHHHRPLLANGSYVPETNLSSVREVNDWNVGTVRLSNQAGSDRVIPKLAIPDAEILSVPAMPDQLTLTALAGAAIYYRFDGKVPSPLFGTLYTGPINPPGEDVTITARAFLAGYIDSDLLREEFSLSL